MIAAMASRPIFGKIIDVKGNKIILVAFSLGMLLTAFLVITPNLINLVLSRLLIGLLGGLVSILTISIINNWHNDHKSSLISKYSLATILPTTVAAPLIVFFIERKGEWLFLCIACILCSVICLSNVRYSSNVEKRKEKEKNTNNLNLAIFSLIIFLASIINGANLTFIPIYIKEITDSDKLMGSYIFAQALSLFFFRWVLSFKDLSFSEKSSSNVIIFLIFSGAISQYILSLNLSHDDLILLYAAAILNGACFAGIFPMMLSIMSNQKINSVGIGIFISLADLGIITGNIVIGYIINVNGFKTGFWLTAIIMTIAMLLMLFFSYISNIYFNKTDISR